MNKPLCVVISLVSMMGSAVMAKPVAEFGYNDHKKLDPMKPLVSVTGVVYVDDANMAVSDMKLEGVLADPSGKNMAIVNGKVVKAGDRLGPYRIDAILVDQVKLVKDQEYFFLKLLKNGGM